MERRQFIKSGIFFLGLTAISKIEASSIFTKTIEKVNDYKERIMKIIEELKKEGANLVKKVMNGKKYKYDPYTHYPYDEGIRDYNTGYQLFFHIHRPKEAGHFHTFALDETGELVHLILISMNREGQPIGLATVNRWVTGDKYVKANVLNKLSKNFFIEPSLFNDERIVEFVNYLFKGYSEEINRLYEERDNWINNYVNKNFREPFEDRKYEILSFKEVNIEIS